jgi:hypothetical protein
MSSIEKIAPAYKALRARQDLAHARYRRYQREARMLFDRAIEEHEKRVPTTGYGQYTTHSGERYGGFAYPTTTMVQLMPLEKAPSYERARAMDRKAQSAYKTALRYGRAQERLLQTLTKRSR